MFPHENISKQTGVFSRWILLLKDRYTLSTQYFSVSENHCVYIGGSAHFRSVCNFIFHKGRHVPVESFHANIKPQLNYFFLPIFLFPSFSKLAIQVTGTRVNPVDWYKRSETISNDCFFQRVRPPQWKILALQVTRENYQLDRSNDIFNNNNTLVLQTLALSDIK